MRMKSFPVDSLDHRERRSFSSLDNSRIGFFFFRCSIHSCLTVANDREFSHHRYYCHHRSSRRLKFVRLTLNDLNWPWLLLVLIGICAFLTHCYWTRIGVSEIWNTPKWSSMRSSFYRTVRRFSRASSSKLGSERPFSPASAFSEDLDGSALPAPLRKKNTANPPAATAAVVQSPKSPTPKTPSGNNNLRRNSSNQIQPVTTISYNQSVKVKQESDWGTPPGSAQVYGASENDDPSVVIHTRRF